MDIIDSTRSLIMTRKKLKNNWKIRGNICLLEITWAVAGYHTTTDHLISHIILFFIHDLWCINIRQTDLFIIDDFIQYFALRVSMDQLLKWSEVSICFALVVVCLYVTFKWMTICHDLEVSLAFFVSEGFISIVLCFLLLIGTLTFSLLISS